MHHRKAAVAWLRRARHRVALFVAVGALAAGGGACRVQAEGGDTIGPRLTVPKVFYLQPHGDKSEMPGKVPFHVVVEDGSDPTTVEGRREDGRLAVSVVGPGKSVRLKTSGSRCSGDGLTVTCKVAARYDNWADLGRVAPVATFGSTAGARAELAYRYTTADGTVLTGRTRVVVGEPVLEVQAPTTLSGVLPGSEIALAITVRNTGEVPAEGLGIGLDVPAGEGFDLFHDAGNCRYKASSARHTAVCRLPDVRLRPGETVTLAPALRIRAPETVLASKFRQEAWPLDLGPQQYSHWPADGDAGDGAPLTRAAAPAGEGRFSVEGVAWTEVELASSADFEAIGAVIDGAPGSERKVNTVALGILSRWQPLLEQRERDSW